MNTPFSKTKIKSTTDVNFRHLLPKLPPLANAAKILLDDTITKPNEIVHGLIHEGTKVVLGGSSKAGKTWLLLLLALCVVSGGKFMRWLTRKGRVLYINFEIPGPFFRFYARHNG